MKILKKENVEWLYNSDREYLMLELFDTMDKINYYLKMIDNEEYLGTKLSVFLPVAHVPQKYEYVKKIRELIFLFKTQINVLYANVSKRPYIFEEGTIKNKCIAFYYESNQ